MPECRAPVRSKGKCKIGAVSVERGLSNRDRQLTLNVQHPRDACATYATRIFSRCCENGGKRRFLFRYSASGERIGCRKLIAISNSWMISLVLLPDPSAAVLSHPIPPFGLLYYFPLTLSSCFPSEPETPVLQPVRANDWRHRP